MIATYSIIIPHKNIPNLLQRCLDSIPIRDDIQIIVVDDNSDSKIVDFEHFPGLDRPNTEVYFDKTGCGAGRARNVGLEHVKGDWVLFADADDTYITENLNSLFNLNIPDECEIVWFGNESLYTNGERVCRNYEYGSSILRKHSNPTQLRHEFAPWKKMIRSSHIKDNDLYFDEIATSNDVMFHVKLVASTQESSIYWFPQLVYVWQQRANSIMHTNIFDNELCRLKVSVKANSFALKRGWGLIDNTNEYLWRVKQYSWCYFYKYYFICFLTLSPRIAWGLFYDICIRDGNKLAILLNPCALVLLKHKLFDK